MSTSGIHKHSIYQVTRYCLTGRLLGLIYISFVNGFAHLYPFINGIIIGLLLGLMIGTFEVYLFRPRFHLNSFVFKLFFRVLTYMSCIIVIILFVVTASRALRHQQSFYDAFFGQESRDYIEYGNFKMAIVYTFIAALLANFARLISFKIGRGTMTDFILGAYHRPKLTDRSFVFLQITNADQVLNTNKVETYHRFINEIYCAISIVLMRNKGFVYDYTDNLIIVYWKGDQNQLVDSVINFYRDVVLSIQQDENHFNNTYKVIPQLRWAAHGGQVVQAEIGELKTEIVFHGDVLNTTSRMLNIAEEMDKPFLISDYIFKRLTKSLNLKMTSMGAIALRGKSQETSLYAIN